MILVVGASGATGQKLVEQLLIQGHQVKAIVRSTSGLPDSFEHPDLTIIKADLLALTDTEIEVHIKDCTAVASCLGHNMSFKGMFGQPRRLVIDATRRLCKAIKTAASNKPVKFVLMNTTGNQNRDLEEPISFAQHCVMVLLRLLLPPHVDNEQAADYLRTQLKDDGDIEWVAVRPDGLIDELEVSDYELHPSPTRSAIFDAGQVSRINVGHFMSELICNDELWQQWKGRMPVIYSKP